VNVRHQSRRPPRRLVELSLICITIGAIALNATGAPPRERHDVVISEPCSGAARMNRIVQKNPGPGSPRDRLWGERGNLGAGRT